ncbi:UNVERIFIED_CONTAM: hypothetical protein FKN15_010152 [Acipenser sinensis]
MTALIERRCAGFQVKIDESGKEIERLQRRLESAESELEILRGHVTAKNTPTFKLKTSPTRVNNASARFSNLLNDHQYTRGDVVNNAAAALSIRRESESALSSDCRNLAASAPVTDEDSAVQTATQGPLFEDWEQIEADGTTTKGRAAHVQGSKTQTEDQESESLDWDQIEEDGTTTKGRTVPGCAEQGAGSGVRRESPELGAEPFEPRALNAIAVLEPGPLWIKEEVPDPEMDCLDSLHIVQVPETAAAVALVKEEETGESSPAGGYSGTVQESLLSTGGTVTRVIQGRCQDERVKKLKTWAVTIRNNPPSQPPSSASQPAAPGPAEKLPFRCIECGRSFGLLQDLVSHLQHHAGGSTFPCPDCGESFGEQQALHAHRRSHSAEAPFPCSTCGQRFWHAQSLQAHSRCHGASGPFLCNDCGRRFGQLHSLQAHRRSHTGEKPFVCGACGKGFVQRQNLEAHRRTHTGDTPHECPDCGKRFSWAESLRKHRLVHTAEKRFHCGDCGKSFRQLSNLQTHQRTHTGERPYLCTACGKRFAVLQNLQTHRRLHTGERPYLCSECGKSFVLPGNLKQHQRIHSGEKPFPCQDCGKHFRQLQSLKIHRRVHTGEKPYHCTVCGRDFNQSQSLKQHLRLHTQRGESTEQH